MLVGIYVCVSTQEQVDGYSLSAQEYACRMYAEANGWQVVKVYADEGMSGTNDDRPQLQQLLADIGASMISVPNKTSTFGTIGL